MSLLQSLPNLCRVVEDDVTIMQSAMINLSHKSYFTVQCAPTIVVGQRLLLADCWTGKQTFQCYPVSCYRSWRLICPVGSGAIYLLLLQQAHAQQHIECKQYEHVGQDVRCSTIMLVSKIYMPVCWQHAVTTMPGLSRSFCARTRLPVRPA